MARRVLVDFLVRLLPRALRADLLHERAREEVVERGRVGVRVLREDVVDVVVARERGEDVVVAVVLRVRADRVRAACVALRNLRLAAVARRPGAVRGGDRRRRHERVVRVRLCVHGVLPVLVDRVRQAVADPERGELDWGVLRRPVRDRLVLVEDVRGERRSVVATVRLGPDREVVGGVLAEARVGEEDLQEAAQVP
jgi:hypothetical protein